MKYAAKLQHEDLFKGGNGLKNVSVVQVKDDGSLD